MRGYKGTKKAGQLISVCDISNSASWYPGIASLPTAESGLVLDMSADWVETKAILSEVEQLFSRDDDICYIYDVKKMAREIDDHCASYLTETKEIIKSSDLSFPLLKLLLMVDILKKNTNDLLLNSLQ